MTTPSGYDFEGLDRVEDVLTDAAASAAKGEEPDYVRLHRIEPVPGAAQPNFVNCGRRQWSRVDMAAYMAEDDGADAPGELGSPFDSLMQEEEEERAAAEGGNAASAETDHRAMAAAMCRWFRDAAAGQMDGLEGEVTFKVELRSPKGAKCLASPRFRCRRVRATVAPTPGANIAALEPTIPMPAPETPRVPVGDRAPAGSWEALNGVFHTLLGSFQRSMALLQAGYAHQMRMTLGSLADVREVHGITTRSLTAELRSLRQQLADKDKLFVKVADELISFRIELAGIGLETNRGQMNDEQKANLLKGAVDTVGKLGEMYLAGKFDIEPELVGLLTIVRADPKLLAALKNPKVHKALRNDEFRAQLVDTLDGVAAGMPDDPPSPTPES